MGKTLTRTDIAKYWSEWMGLNRVESRRVLEDFLEQVSEALQEGDNVKLWGFGNFILRDKAQRPGRNPRNNEAAVISARRVVTFRAGQTLRKRIKESNG